MVYKVGFYGVFSGYFLENFEVYKDGFLRVLLIFSRFYEFCFMVFMGFIDLSGFKSFSWILYGFYCLFGVLRVFSWIFMGFTDFSRF